MCGRFTLTTVDGLAGRFGISGEAPQVTPSFNIAPASEVAAVGADAEGNPRLRKLRWGLVPHWADDPAIGQRMINARAESVAQKPAFKSALQRRRCLILADGFYEWRRPREGESGPKQPYYIRMADGAPYAFAGLWESWKSPEGERLQSTTIITTEANELIADIHHRMPVILDPAHYEAWLDPQTRDAREILPLLAAYPPENMRAHPVSTHVNQPANDDESCVVPVSA